VSIEQKPELAPSYRPTDADLPAIFWPGGEALEKRPRADSWFHSTEFDAEWRSRRARQRNRFRQRAEGIVADPDDFQPSVRKARNRYFEGDKKPRRGDARYELPRSSDLQALADTFGASPERLEQAQELKRRGLAVKAKSLLLCGVATHRLDCTNNPLHRFYASYTCHQRYCENCGPAWFRRKFSDALVAFEPVVERLLKEGQQRGRKMVVARLDFTVPNTGVLPTPEFIQ